MTSSLDGPNYLADAHSPKILEKPNIHPPDIMSSLDIIVRGSPG
jgi:hypothetical protein